MRAHLQFIITIIIIIIIIIIICIFFIICIQDISKMLAQIQEEVPPALKKGKKFMSIFVREQFSKCRPPRPPDLSLERDFYLGDT